MGVSGLPSVIKRTKGFIACDLKKKKCHVDLLSLHFGLMKVHCYHSTATGIRKAAAAATVQSEVVNKKRPASEPPVGQRPVKLRAVDAACDMQGSVEGIKRTPVESILDKIRFATKSLSQDDPQSFQYVATTLDSRLTVYLDKSRTTIHVDGLPSIQKSLERKARQDRLNAELEKLEKQATQFVEGKSRSPAKLFKRCRGLYRPPPTALEMIVEGLTSLGWKVCRCPYQADTHIGELCRDETDKASLAVISNDSDLLIYDGVSCVTMPVGKSRELTTFSKASLLEELDLPSSRHLQLAAMLTKNDYFGGTRTYGIIRNAELVRNLLLDIDGKEDEQELISKFHSAIGDYFALIKNVKDFPIDDDISNAISAFVLCREDRSDSATPSPQTHQRVSDVLRQLEYAKLQRRGLLSQACTTISNVSSSSTNELTITTGSLETQSVLSLNNSGKAKQSRKESAKMKKQERWTKARFKSPNLDKNPRYTAHVVKDVTSACPVAQGTLGKLTLSVPRPRKPKKEQEMQPENACQESAKKEQEIEPGKPCQDSAKKKQQKGLADMRKKGPSAGPKEGKKREIGDCKILKNLFDTTFKTVTLTLGCFTGTLRRATSMTQDEAQVVASHMDKAAHTLSKARILVFKGLEYFVYRQVTSKTPSTNIVQSNVVNMQSSSESITINHPPSSSSPSMDPLDLFLNKQHGQTLIRNLISLILNGKINGGRSSKDPCGIQARQEAQQIYRELELVFSGVIPLNVKDDRMCLATAIGEMAAKIFTSIRVHFGRLPELISTRMLKIGCGQDSLTDITIEPPSTGKSEASIGKIMDVSEIDQVDTEEAEADRYKFDPGHVMECWSQYIRLPLELRPVFVPTAGFRDTFQQLSERDLIPLLWGDKRSKIVPPTKSIMDSHVCSREEAETAEQSHYGDLVRKLFIGDKENIRDDRKKRQTSYGKRSTTMGFLSDDCQAFSRSSLQQYVDSHFAYINAKKGLVLGSSNALPSPPTLPRSNVPAARYALSNQLYTDGIQVHVVAYDTRKPRVGSNQKTSIPKLEKRFPNRQSMVNDLGVSFEDTVVVGIDPGEKISAAFCMVDPKRPKQVSNLSIRRNALYSPSLSYRARLEEMKRHRITVSTASGISPSPWTPADEIQVTTPIGESETQRHDMDTIELPISINELQQSLEQSAFQSMEAYEEGLRNCAGVFQLLNGFYSSRSLKKLHWERMKAMRAEKDLAVHGALRMIRGTNGRKAIFAYGDGKFNTRTKLSSMHETFKNYFVMKASSMGHIVVCVDEYNTSTMCPSCVSSGKTSRLSKPTSRSTVCLQDGCRRWMDRDHTGAHNMANIGRCWIKTLTRPEPLCRPLQGPVTL